MQQIKILVQKLSPSQAVKVLPFLRFWQIAVTVVKQFWSTRLWAHGAWLEHQKDTKIVVRLTGIHRHEKSGSVSTQLYRNVIIEYEIQYEIQ